MIEQQIGNGHQVRALCEAISELDEAHVGQVAEHARGAKVYQAKKLAQDLPRSASRYSAISSIVMGTIRSLRKRLPKPATASERWALGGVTSLVEAALFAMEARPELGDETVALLVDPFADLLNFEWRSWGVSAERDLGGQGGAPVDPADS